jgi:hypothetical protein
MTSLEDETAQRRQPIREGREPGQVEGHGRGVLDQDLVAAEQIVGEAPLWCQLRGVRDVAPFSRSSGDRRPTGGQPGQPAVVIGLPA